MEDIPIVPIIMLLGVGVVVFMALSGKARVVQRPANSFETLNSGSRHPWALEVLAELARLPGLDRDDDQVHGKRKGNRVHATTSATEYKGYDGGRKGKWAVDLYLRMVWGPGIDPSDRVRTDDHTPLLEAAIPDLALLHTSEGVRKLRANAEGMELAITLHNTAQATELFTRCESLAAAIKAQLDAPMRAVAQVVGLLPESNAQGQVGRIQGPVDGAPFELERRSVGGEPGWQLELWLPGLPEGFALRAKGRPDPKALPISDPILSTRLSVRGPDQATADRLLGEGGLHGPLLSLLDACPSTRVVGGRLIIEAQGHPPATLPELLTDARAVSRALRTAAGSPPLLG